MSPEELREYGPIGLTYHCSPTETIPSQRQVRFPNYPEDAFWNRRRQLHPDRWLPLPGAKEDQKRRPHL